MTAEKKNIQETPKAPAVEETATPQQVKVLSAQDTQIADLVKEQPTEAEVAKLKVSEKAPNILELPEECYPLYKVKYRYRWLAKDKYLDAKLRSTIWMLCTRSNSPYIKPTRFKDHGAVEQAGMLLAFCSEEAGLQREHAPAIKSKNLVKHYTEDIHKTGTTETGGYYKPEESDGGDDGDDDLTMD